MNGLLRNRCSIERRPDAAQVSATGEDVTIYETIGVNVPCLIQPRSGSYRQHDYGKVQAVTHRMFFGADTDVRVGDRIALGDARYLLTFIADQMGRFFEADAALIVAP